jgi:hypothetical protein
MSFSVPEGREQTAQKVINGYFNALQKHGPGGMRSQCYADHDKDGNFVHIKSFQKRISSQSSFPVGCLQGIHEQLATLCGIKPCFSRLQQQQPLNLFISVTAEAPGTQSKAGCCLIALRTPPLCGLIDQLHSGNLLPGKSDYL